MDHLLYPSIFQQKCATLDLEFVHHFPYMIFSLVERLLCWLATARQFIAFACTRLSVCIFSTWYTALPQSVIRISLFVGLKCIPAKPPQPSHSLNHTYASHPLPLKLHFSYFLNCRKIHQNGKSLASVPELQTARENCVELKANFGGWKLKQRPKTAL